MRALLKLWKPVSQVEQEVEEAKVPKQANSVVKSFSNIRKWFRERRAKAQLQGWSQHQCTVSILTTRGSGRRGGFRVGIDNKKISVCCCCWLENRACDLRLATCIPGIVFIDRGYENCIEITI